MVAKWALFLALLLAAALHVGAESPPSPAAPASADDYAGDPVEAAADEDEADDFAEEEEEMEEEEEAEAEAAAPASAADEAAPGVQFVVTNKMKAELAALGYSAEEVAGLSAERASAIISRKIERPGRGVPATWNRRTGGGPLSKLAVGGKSALRALTSGKGLAFSGVAAILAAILGLGLGGAGGGGSKVAAAAPVAEEPVATPSRRREPEAELWLDRMIDRAIDRIRYGKE